jgi:hypothetical protein
MSKLQNVIQFNEEMLEGAIEDIAAALRDGSHSTDGGVTDQRLDSEEMVVCWTCGTEVKRGSIEATLDRLRELRQSKYSEQNDVESRIDELKPHRDSIQSEREERERVGECPGEVRAEIEELEQEDRPEVLELAVLVDELGKRRPTEILSAEPE